MLARVVWVDGIRALDKLVGMGMIDRSILLRMGWWMEIDGKSLMAAYFFFFFFFFFDDGDMFL